MHMLFSSQICIIGLFFYDFFFFKQKVCNVLSSNPKGEEIFNEYDKTKTLSDPTHRQMVNILVTHVILSYLERIPPISVRTNYALGIATLFPYLQDPYSKNGYIDQDFAMMLGDEASGRFLTKWSSYFKQKIIAESQSLPSSPCVEELRASFDTEASNDWGKSGQCFSI
uniref:Uncharacterized protein n=1 Tax=Maylandia zebra TaxID=106582 RepID=A0A3P9D6X6_9CICH